MRRENAARLQVGEQVLHGEQAWISVDENHRPDNSYWPAKLGLIRIEPISAGKSVENNLGVQMVAHVLQIAPQRGR